MSNRDQQGLRLRARLRALYHGASPTAVRFRYAVIGVDLLVIAFFIAAPTIRNHGLAFYLADYAAATFLALDMSARAIAHGDIRAWLKKPIVWVDLFVLATLLFPTWLLNLGFLRVVRLWTLIHSEFFWHTVGRRYDNTRVEEIAKAASSLLTFVFVITGFVYSSFAGRHDGVTGYVDALYFTVTSLTTTGYGDITLPGVWGKLLSIATMLGGVSLFISLIQSILRPHKVTYQCHDCGLRRHDPDAVHCKACGKMLNIPDDGV
ncbi:potassium channel family protein [Caulobacter henricii]|uniref:Ion transporter n=1 Tax=Caulobacter henricii TaxID=69395 RepID=A0A0P0P3D0_9CAUL|nr:potassium channel family protein [Caulobacter henricii]ALL15037.1 ion transporter [Caulobacter henricii]